MMNKIVKQGVLLLIFFASFQLLTAQGKYGETPEDSITCIKSLIYKEYMNSDTALALSLWRAAIKACPKAQKSLYINGVKLYTKYLIPSAKNDSLKQLYKDTVYQLFDQRIKYFGQKGKVLGLKAQTMLSFREKSKASLIKVNSLLREAVDLMKEKTDPGTLIARMFTIIQMEKNKLTTKDSLIMVYEDLIIICNKNIENSSAKKQGHYKKVQEKINNMSSRYLTCEIITKMAATNFEKNKTNTDWLKRMALLLKYKKCVEAPIFFEVSEASFHLSPSSQGAANLGLLYTAKKKFPKAISFITKAIELDTAKENEAKFRLDLARIYFLKKDFSSARTNALKALKLNADLVAAYVLIGDAYAASYSTCDNGKLGKWAAYWAAEDKYKKALNKAKEEKEKGAIRKKIAQIKHRYPSQKDIFFFGKSAGETIAIACWINEKTTIRIKK